MGHKCNHILSPKSLRAFTFSLHHCSETIKIEMLLLYTLHSLGWDNSHARHMSSLKFDTLHLLWSADKTFEWNTASIVVQSVVWAAALDRLQRRRKKKEAERRRQTERAHSEIGYLRGASHSPNWKTRWRCWAAEVICVRAGTRYVASCPSPEP